SSRPTSTKRSSRRAPSRGCRSAPRAAVGGLGSPCQHTLPVGRRVPGRTGRHSLATQSLAAQIRVKRSEMMISELESVALRLFDERGFSNVTVDEIASEAQISVRTFYRYFPAKEDVLQVQIDRRSGALRTALSTRPVDEPPLHSLRLALAEVLAAED